MTGVGSALYKLPPMRASKKTKREDYHEQEYELALSDVQDREQRASKRCAGSLPWLCPTAASF